MRPLHCPNCGRFRGETDAPPGYRIRVPPCVCKTATVFRTDREYPPRHATVAPSTGRR